MGLSLTLTSASTLKFGTLSNPGSSKLIPAILAAVIIGASAGILGAIFVATSKFTFKLRKKYVITNWQKVLEVVCFAAVTSFSFFLLVRLNSRCAPLPP